MLITPATTVAMVNTLARWTRVARHFSNMWLMLLTMCSCRSEVKDYTLDERVEVQFSKLKWVVGMHFINKTSIFTYYFVISALI